MRMAFSIASAPPFVKNTFEKPSGACDRMSSAARALVSLAWAGAIVTSCAACSWMAAMTFGCWYPMVTFTSWLEKSRYSLPSKSHSFAPSPRAMGSGVIFPWADQEWNTEARSRSRTSALLREVLRAEAVMHPLWSRGCTESVSKSVRMGAMTRQKRQNALADRGLS